MVQRGSWRDRETSAYGPAPVFRPLRVETLEERRLLSATEAIWIEGEDFTTEEIAKHFRDHPAIDEPVGTGPYAVPSPRVLDRLRVTGDDGWKRGSYIKVIRTGEFWDPERRGHLDVIYFYIFSSGEGIVLPS